MTSPAALARRPPEWSSDVGERGDGPSEAAVRRWLQALGRPATLPDPDLTDLLERHGRLPSPPTAVAAGDAVRDLLVQAIERLQPPAGAPRAQALPYQVLTMCFVDGVKWAAAADRLGISPRHLTRERSRAIQLLREELVAMAAAPGPRYREERIPAIDGFMPRPGVTRAIAELLARDHLVHVHGPRGIGKTSTVAELATELTRRAPVLWLRFRAGVNTSLAAVAFELAEHLRAHGRPALAEALDGPHPDLGFASRVAIRDLAGGPRIVVLDDYHLTEDDPAVAGFVEEAAARLPDLRVITVGRHAAAAPRVGSAFAIPPMTRIETQELLAKHDVAIGAVMAGSIHAWTEGLPHLVKLAAAWLRTASEDEVNAGVGALRRSAEVHDFLLDSISELLDAADRAVLDAASVFRDRFTDESLAHVSEQTVGAIEDTSRRLVRRHLASRGRTGDVAFFHASVREHFYARLVPERRAALHRRAADWYAEHGNPREAAYHRERS